MTHQHTSRQGARGQRQTFANNADDSISITLHFQQFNHLLNVGVLFFETHRRWLSKHGTESQRLPDGGSFKMKVLLLNVSRLSLEGIISRTAIYEQIAGDNTCRDSTGQNIEERCFTRSRSTLTSC